jgi:hypothetical protein
MKRSLSHAPRSLALALAALALSAPAAVAGSADQRSPDSGQRAASKEQHYVKAISSLTPAQLAAAFGTNHSNPNDAQLLLPAIPTGPLPWSHGGPRVAQTPTAASNTANVYVPRAAAFTDTVAPATASANSPSVDRYHPDTSPSSSGFDWGSAAIGAAATGGLVLIAFAGFGVTYSARIRVPR